MEFSRGREVQKITFELKLTSKLNLFLLGSDFLAANSEQYSACKSANLRVKSETLYQSMGKIEGHLMMPKKVVSSHD